MLKKNEKGFTLVESLLSLTVLFLMTNLIFPQLFVMIHNLQSAWDEVTASRYLYEYVEENFYSESMPHTPIMKQGGMEYQIYETEKSGKRQVCIRYSGNEKCIQEQ